jgi:hypothetical protein
MPVVCLRLRNSTVVAQNGINARSQILVFVNRPQTSCQPFSQVTPAVSAAVRDIQFRGTATVPSGGTADVRLDTVTAFTATYYWVGPTGVLTAIPVSDITVVPCETPAETCKA